ncbi:MAG: bifunctional tRNA pseudouridine(32) synthase/23S rRNA pseudouridine(746) synthase RluA [Gammaproteobacteria bacterium]|nr:MAG: bifunctional tRNA pseudouridine(32) synthase/23S rRNA pseudouridine(746) synthase RluA [Gammaproteobacteria bacterium]
MNPYTPPTDTGLDLLYQDDALLVVNKPHGLLSVPGRGADKQDCITSRVQEKYPAAITVHRLDMETSGVMVMALNKPVQRKLSLLFQERRVQKRYIAVVNGCMQSSSGQIDLPLIADWPNRPRQKVDRENGKPSTTYFRVIGRDRERNSTRVELKPVTGRTHQLRVHLRALGHSILGDRLYSDGDACTRAGRLMLHAESLAFHHPGTNEFLNFEYASPF